MKLSNMFKKTDHKNYISLTTHSPQTAPEIPEGLMKKCSVCKSAVFAENLKQNNYICPKCGNYLPVKAKKRLAMVVDKSSFIEWDKGLDSGNPLDYEGYEDKLEALREKTHLDEAVVTGQAKIGGNDIVIAVCDGRFMMGSMGKVVGEKIACAVERATERRLPLIIFTCSGGARMQEGIHSLMQMAKTSAALKRHHDAGLLYVTVLTHPTTGGVTASFAMLGDIILAEPGALIGFAGPRVIEQTIGQKLPKGFQHSEFLLEHGFVDQIVERPQLRETLLQLIEMHSKESKTNTELSVENKKVESAKQRTTALSRKTAWERVQLSRKSGRPVGSDYIQTLFTDFMECHGDRYYKDDSAIIGGIARFHGLPVTVIAQEKGKNTKDNIQRNFGMPSPDGYRKALRLMKQAEKFDRPVICFVDTPGAFCGLEAEERGQGEAIARNLFEISGLKVPVLSVVIGEGGSGGALAMAVADEVWMLENSIYSILSPEGFASILWKDSKRAKEAAGVMQLTAADLKKAGIVERVFMEPEEFTEETLEQVTDVMEICIEKFLDTHLELSAEELTEKRYQRFRHM